MAATDEQKNNNNDRETTILLLNLLKVDKRGWNICLFEDNSKIRACLCNHCKSVCRDAVELGCDHEDKDIFTYCNSCLSDLIQNNNDKCPINNHENPIIFSLRSNRRQILTSIVICPYSVEFKQMSKEIGNNQPLRFTIERLN